MVLKTRPDLASMNAELKGKGASERILRFNGIFGDGLVLATSFGRYSEIMLKLATDVFPNILVIYVNHGCWPDNQKQQEFADSARKRFRLNLLTVEPREAILYSEVCEARLENAGREGDSEALIRFRRIGKIEPLQRALSTLYATAWMSVASKEQTPNRKNFEIMMEGSFYKLYPIIDWVEAVRIDFVEKNRLRFNKDYFDVFKAGNKECGIHVTDLRRRDYESLDPSI